MTRIALVGAAGIIGSQLARQLAEEAGVELLLADRAQTSVGSLARELGARHVELDVTERQSLGPVGKVDLVANASSYRVNLDVMALALAADADYIDLGGLYHTTRRQLSLHESFHQRGRTAILGCGKAPGITNLLLAEGVSSFERVDRVQLRSGRRGAAENGEPTIPYSPATLIDEFTLPPVVLRGGKLTELEALSERETISHPEPWGTIDYLTTLHSELATLPAFVGREVQSMDFKVALSRPTSLLLESLVRLGLTSEEPVLVGEAAVRPRDLAIQLLGRLPTSSGPEEWLTEAEILGTTSAGYRRMLLRASANERANGTVIGALGAISLWRKGTHGTSGVNGPESALDSTQFLEELRRRGLRIDVKTESIVPEPAPA